MDIVISDETKRATTNCRKNFCCLSTDREKICKIKECINNKVCFVSCENSGDCLYKMSFGNGYVCNCPVRKDLYKKYNI